MPFKKLSKGKYKSPSGHKFNLAQVRLWYANGGKFSGQKSDRAVVAKGPKHRRVPIHKSMA